MMQRFAAKPLSISPQIAGLHTEGEEELEHSAMPLWLETIFPWMSSFTMHLSIFLVALFVYWAGMKVMAAVDGPPIVIPDAVNIDLGASGTPGGIPHPGPTNDPNTEAGQLMKRVKDRGGWADVESSKNAFSMLPGKTSDITSLLITTGTGGSVGDGDNGAGRGRGGPLAPYGTPGGSGAGLKSNFYGDPRTPRSSTDYARRIVYILDHSGSMLDNFDFLREEAKNSVQGLSAIQFYNVVMVSEQASVVLSKGQLVRGTPDNCRDFFNKIADYRAQGQNDDLLAPFQEAFEEAFRMKPDLIYFLTDGHFSPELSKIVNRLNADKKVKINTYAYINKEPSYEVQLQAMAKDNGGRYKFVTEKDLGK